MIIIHMANLLLADFAVSTHIITRASSSTILLKPRLIHRGGEKNKRIQPSITVVFLPRQLLTAQIPTDFG